MCFDQSYTTATLHVMAGGGGGGEHYKYINLTSSHPRGGGGGGGPGGPSMLNEGYEVLPWERTMIKYEPHFY